VSDTGPSELSKIIGSEEGFRLYMVQKMERIDGRIELVVANQERHETDDERRFEELDKKFVGVSSNVGGLESDRAKVVGVKEAVMVLAKVGVAVIAAGWALWLTFFKGQP
jgi:hypothetical protein